MASARNVTLASTTCRTWGEAAKNHLQKLSFDDFDFCSGSGNLQSSPCEKIITEVLMRKTCLCALLIFIKRKDEPVLEFEADPITAWLQHTKKANLSMNILDVLFGGESILKYLEWGCAYIPSVDPTIHRFESLV